MVIGVSSILNLYEKKMNKPGEIITLLLTHILFLSQESYKTILQLESQISRRIADLLALWYMMVSCVFVTFPHGVLGRVWYLILLFTCKEIHLIQPLFRLKNTKSCITLLG